MLYGEYAMGSLFFGGQVAYLNFDQTTTRSLGAWWNSVSRDSVVTNGVGGQIAAGLRLGFDGWSVEPTLALAVLGLSSPATVEQNPNGLAQQVNGQSLTSVRGAVTLPCEPYVSRWPTSARSRCADSSAGRMNSQTCRPPPRRLSPRLPVWPLRRRPRRSPAIRRWSACPPISLFDDGVAFFAGWQGSIGSSSTAQTFRAGLRMTW